METPYLQGVPWKDKGEWGQVNGHTLLLGRCQLDTRGMFFSRRTSSPWNNLPREVLQSPASDT